MGCLLGDLLQFNRKEEKGKGWSIFKTKKHKKGGVMSNFAVKWPVKVKKFGITDPILKFLVARYEKEIPWQTRVKNQETLLNFVKDNMLNSLYLQANLNYFKEHQKGFFVRREDVDADRFLSGGYGFKWKKWRDEIEKTRYTKSLMKANEILAEKINMLKERRFSEWKNTLKKLFPDEPQFALVLLRPLFSEFGEHIRNPLSKPNKRAIIKLHHLLKKEKINPNINLVALYFDLLSINTFIGRWYFVSKERGGVNKLSALSAGSGWCTFYEDYGWDYLAKSDFYILRIDGKSRVALRIGKDFNLVEMVGVRNTFPKKWIEEIAIFIKLMGFKVDCRINNIIEPIYRDLPKKNFLWWKRMKQIFPFSVYLAPENYKKILAKSMEPYCAKYSDFPNFEELLKLVNLNKKTVNANKNIILDNPLFFTHLPKEEQERLKGICVRSWINRAKMFGIKISEVKDIPPFVKYNKKFSQILMKNFPITVDYMIKVFVDKHDDIDINEIFKPTKDEPYDLALKRMINFLLKRCCKRKLTSKIPDYLRSEFDRIKKDAWIEIIKADPSFYFIMPNEIRNEKEFVELFKPKNVKASLIEKWKNMVYKNPHILRTKSGIPKSLKWHPEILKAYRNRCDEILADTAYIWLKEFNINCNHIYMKQGRRILHIIPYAFVNDKLTIDKLSKRFIKEKFEIWYKADRKAKRIPAVQYSLLKALDEWVRMGNFDIKIVKDLLFAVEVRTKKYVKAGFKQPYFYGDMLDLLRKLNGIIGNIQSNKQIIRKAG